MPITHKPTNPVPPDYQPPNTTGRKVKTGESLASIAAEYGITWQQLTDLNWKTHIPDEVNWYLYHNFGCRTVSPDGYNYSFSDADPGTLWVPASTGPIPGGGLPGEGGSGGPAPSPEDATPGEDSDPNRVARNDVNLLKLPVVRLPVGWRVPQPTAVTRFRLWIPTDSGGVLKLTHENGGTVDLRKPFRTVLQAAAAEVTYEVKPGEFGEFFVIATGAANNMVTCTFVQISFSRDGTGDADPPLIPWNFYYWPTALSIRQSDGTTAPNHWSDDAADLMERYGKAFGKNPAQCRAAEKSDHGTPAVGAGWEGHCHNAAPASMLFEPPTAQTYNGQSFTREEMQHLAAEFFGNFGQFGPDWWELKRSSKPGRWYLPGYFKPGGPKTRDAFVTALKSELAEATAGTTADSYVSAAGGEAAFEKLIGEYLGELAAEFYDSLVRFTRVKKHPLLSNMRSYVGSSGPEEVWNQGYFWYRAWYRENGDTQDEKDLVILCQMRANLDTYTTGMPAMVVSGDEVPTDGKSLVFENEWRLQFDGSGKIVVTDTKNEWRHLKNSSGEELFAPTELLTLAKSATSRKSGDAFSLGNKFVGTDLVTAGLLTIHKRYQ